MWIHSERSDMFPRTGRAVKMPLICFHERPRGFDILAINSCHVETVVLMTRIKLWSPVARHCNLRRAESNEID